MNEDDERLDLELAEEYNDQAYIGFYKNQKKNKDEGTDLDD